MAKTAAKKSSDLEDYLRRVGGEEAVGRMQADPISVKDVIQDGDDPFGFYGADYRPDLMRYSWVPNAAAAERLKRQAFFAIDGDVKMRGLSGGIIMGRLLRDEATYRAARQQRDYERRTGRTQQTKQMGDGANPGRFSLTSKNSPRMKRIDGED